jgi:glycosyltransferase involved in cell wall biosynthesis
MPLIQVFVATHNRPSLVLNAISSILNQSFSTFDLIISDNSTNDDSRIAISAFNDPRLKYIRRERGLNVIDHLNVILKDVTAEYFMIFHDDDIMHPNMLNELYENILLNPDCIAIGANARILKPGFFPWRLMLKNKKGNLLISNRDQMAHQYLIKRGIVPLSSYLYKGEIAKKLRFNPENGGKHCDAAFMMDIASTGNILMLIKPLMDYYISAGQDSSINDFLNRIRLVNYITKTTIYKNDSYLIKRFRIVNLYYELLQDAKKIHQISGCRRLKILKLILKVSPLDFFPRAIMHLFFIKAT